MERKLSAMKNSQKVGVIGKIWLVGLGKISIIMKRGKPKHKVRTTTRGTLLLK